LGLIDQDAEMMTDVFQWMWDIIANYLAGHRMIQGNVAFQVIKSNQCVMKGTHYAT
jgi:hypothetical protein